MYKLCKTEQSAMRQRELERGLLKMMLQYRYEDISVSDLCDQLEIPRKSFYRYFSSKDGALYAMLDHSMMDYFATGAGILGTSPGTQRGDLIRYFAFWREHGDLLDALQRNGLSGILVERAMELALRERLMPKYIREMDLEIQQMAMAFSVCGLLSMVIRWHSHGFSASSEEMAKIALGLLTKPLLQ